MFHALILIPNERREDEPFAVSGALSSARESPTTRHAQKVHINPPPCFAEKN